MRVLDQPGFLKPEKPKRFFETTPELNQRQTRYLRSIYSKWYFYTITNYLLARRKTEPGDPRAAALLIASKAYPRPTQATLAPFGQPRCAG
jgi:hypothetical protein